MIRRKSDRARSVKIGDREFLTKGLDHSFWKDAFHNSMRVSWPTFFLGFAVYFIAINAIFATLFWIGGDCIANARPGSFADRFYFSIETLATVGYGDMHPDNDYAHLVTTLEIFVGMSTLAVYAGLVFARFARPRAKVLFADVMAMGRHNGGAMLMARIANARNSTVNEAQAEIWLLYSEPTTEGVRFRRFKQLTLLQRRNPIFAFSWTLFHPIDEHSPLFGLGQAELEEMDAYWVVIFDGLDDVSGQKVNARKGYGVADLRIGHVYSDILTASESGLPQLDYGLLHETEPDEVEAEPSEQA
ncbi:ion channel [Rhodoblastus sp.]|uniref:ion channel n=2 Tax=Rhodoblastus sp. TaxID=1962975 RepID=UPI003F9432EF